MDKTKKKAFAHARRRSNEPTAVRSSGLPSRPAVPAIELFQRESSPGCHAVRVRLSELGLDYVSHNVPVENDLKHEQLVRAGGKDRIPFLIDHSSGVKLYDSVAINAYLDGEYGEVTASFFEKASRRAESRIRTRADQILWLARRPLDRYMKLRHDFKDFTETVAGALRVAREQFRSETKTHPAEASPGGAAAGDELSNGGDLEAEVA